VTRAEIELVDPDTTRAREFLVQARRFLADAARETTHLESAEGRRVGSGVRVEATRGLLGAGFGDLCDRLDEWRRQRHEVSYAAITPAAADVEAMQTDARDILGAAEAHIRRR